MNKDNQKESRKHKTGDIGQYILKVVEREGPEVATAPDLGYLFFLSLHRLWVILGVASDCGYFQSPKGLLPVGRGSFKP